jgi:citrate lyase subunit beta/citryl-CoA lyase
MDIHPRQALFDLSSNRAPSLPVCDHQAGIAARMIESLEVQAEMGPLFDITLDCADGAPVGGELEHALCVAELIDSPSNAHDRVGVRLHPVRHRAFALEADALVHRCGHRLAYVMLPRVNGLVDLQRGCDEIDHLSRVRGLKGQIPLHVLIETHGALSEVAAIAAHPRVESLSFGLVDFVAAHRGAIPGSATSAGGQFEHPLVVRAKLEVAAACHANAKIPSHCVVTEFGQPAVARAAARKAARGFGYTRMRSIHRDQIQPIIEAFSPSSAEVDQAAAILLSAQAAQWAPTSHPPGAAGTLHDRASYRCLWQVLELAHRTGHPVPYEAERAFFADAAA